MDAEAEEALIGFVRGLAEACKECHRKFTNDCRNCTAATAKALYQRVCPQTCPMEAESYVRVRERRDSILRQLSAAEHPVAASKICCENCDAGCKSMTLSRMVRDRIIERTKKGRLCFYSLPKRLP